jgi:hypothetical protein
LNAHSLTLKHPKRGIKLKQIENENEELSRRGLQKYKTNPLSKKRQKTRQKEQKDDQSKAKTEHK